MPPAPRRGATQGGYRPVDVIEVRAWDRMVGAVVRNPASGFYAFEYDAGWVATGIELAPLHMPARAGVVYEFPALPPHTFYRLPALLADALPDAFGNALVDAWMAEHGLRAADITALDRLAYAGDRAVGALQFHPPTQPVSTPAAAVQMADLVVAAREVIRGDFSEAGSLHESLRQLIQVGTSAGGARAKVVVAYNEDTGQVRSGQLDAPEGYAHWLVKLDGVGGTAAGSTLDSAVNRDGAAGQEVPYGVIEYAYHLMATAAGVAMSECRLLPEGPRTHFMTRRFDRGRDDAGMAQRHHVLSLCAADHLDFRMRDTHSYAQFFAAVEQLGMGAQDKEQVFRRMVFNVAAANRDDHTKNSALLLRQGERDWRIAPAFDITHAHNPRGEWTTRHQMSVNGTFDGVGLADLYAVGEQFSVPGYRQLVRQVLAAVDDWQGFATAAGLGEPWRSRIAADLADVRPT